MPAIRVRRTAPSIRINRVAPFPSRVTGSGAVTVVKTNGVWTVGLDYTPIAPVVPIPAQYATTYLLAYNTTTQLWEKVSILDLQATVPGAPLPPDLVTSGATIGSPFPVSVTQGGAVVKKTIAAASYLLMPLTANMTALESVIKDGKGDAFTNNITISFSGGELCDGLAQVVINNNFGWVTLSKTPGGGSWYQK